MRVSISTAIVWVGLSTSLHADFSYQQSTKVTGGMMAGMMKMAGAFSKEARQPMDSKIMVKGDQMVTITGSRMSLIDLKQETMTEVDLEKQTYATVTFAQMTQAMAKMSEKMGQKNTDAEIAFKADVKDTGEKRNIAGFPAKQTILSLELKAKDRKSGAETTMLIDNEMWLTPSLAGYDEVKSFYQRMGQKLAWTPGGGMFSGLAARQPGMGEGMAELMKQGSKLEGIPVLQITRMRPMGGGAGMGMSEKDMAEYQRAMEQAEREAKNAPPPPSAGDVATQAATQAGTQAALNKMKLGGLGGAIGGFGGFGRKKKPQAEEAPAAAQAPPAPTAAPVSTAPAGTLMELTIESSNFSSAPVDGAQFAVPAGFKAVEHQMVKGLQ